MTYEEAKKMLGTDGITCIVLNGCHQLFKLNLIN